MALCIDPTAFGDMAGQAVDVIGAVLADPNLPQFVFLLEQIREENAAAGVTGFGLQSFIFPLEAYLFYRQHPLLTLALAASVLALPFGLGYAVAKHH